MTSTFLTPDELKQLTGKLRRHSQASALRTMGIGFRVRPDGFPVVMRTQVEEMFNAPMKTKRSEPDWSRFNA